MIEVNELVRDPEQQARVSALVLKMMKIAVQKAETFGYSDDLKSQLPEEYAIAKAALDEDETP